MRDFQWLSRPMIRGAALGLACGLFCWALALHPVLRGLEEWFQDANIVYRGVRNSSARDRLVIVAIDDNTLIGMTKPLAFLSPELAELVNYLDRNEAAAIGIDLI